MSLRVEFGKVCAHFAAAFTAMVALVALLLIEPRVLVWFLIAVAVLNGILGIWVFFEMHRKDEVKGKGLREVR